MGKRAERAARAELKKEKIRADIWKFMEDCVTKKLTSEQTGKAVNVFIEIMKRSNPQENHLVSAVCCEIRQDSKAFAQRMIAKMEKGQVSSAALFNPS